MTDLRILICHGTRFSPSKNYKCSPKVRTALRLALGCLSAAAQERHLHVPYLISLYGELRDLDSACRTVSERIAQLSLTREQGHRWMEEVAENLYGDETFRVPCKMLALQLRSPQLAQVLRRHDGALAPVLREDVAALLRSIEVTLERCGEKTGQSRRGRPPENPAIVAATKVLTKAGLTPAQIEKAIGNEIAAVREHTRQTRNGRAYEHPTSIRRTLRRHRKNPA